MIYKAIISVMPLKEILDPQGKAVKQAIEQLGIGNIEEVRIGKQIELEITASSVEAAQNVAIEASRKILANPIMEDFRIEIVEVG